MCFRDWQTAEPRLDLEGNCLPRRERVSGCQTTRNRSERGQVNREDVEVSQFPVPPGIL